MPHLVMGNIDSGDAQLLLDLPQFRADVHTQLGIQVGKGFVQKQDLLAHHQCPGKGHPLLLTAGHLLGNRFSSPTRLNIFSIS